MSESARHCVGLSNIIFGYLGGKLSEETLGKAHLWLECTRDVFLRPGFVPVEATWSNLRQSRRYGVGAVTMLEDVDAVIRPDVEHIVSLIRAAEGCGAVTWNISGEFDVLRKLEKEHPEALVYWQGLWGVAASLIHTTKLD